MNIEIKKLSDEEKNRLSIEDWPIWTKEISIFDWFYDSVEYCQILEGIAIIRSEFEEVKIQAGDFVIFPKGLACNWNIVTPIKKHYKFE